MVKLDIQYKNPNGKGYKHEIFEVDFLNTKGFCIFAAVEENTLVFCYDEEKDNIKLDFGVNWIQASITSIL